MKGGDKIRFKRKNTAFDPMYGAPPKKIALLDIEFVIGKESVQYSKAEHNHFSLAEFYFYGEIQIGVDYGRYTSQYQLAKFRMLNETLNNYIERSKDGFIKLQTKLFLQVVKTLL